MYKTVRKGEASLQYTILPQTDQSGQGGFPSASGKSRPRLVRYVMGSLMILIILSCVATPFLMNQYDRNLLASTMLAIGRVGYGLPLKNLTRSQSRDLEEQRDKGRMSSTTLASPQSLRKKDTSTESSVVSKSQLQDHTDAISKVSDESAISTQESSESMSTEQVSIPSTASPTSGTTRGVKSSAATPTGTTRSSTGSPKKANMLRVTLKLRENETIPKMYMQAGIASYKKGNITTSVLAHRLSLEGLIIKTPEGTIKPWPQKWLFSDPSSELQWKNQMPATIYIVLVGLAALASLSIVLMFYVQRKASKRQRPSAEEPEVGGQDEDKSTLLGADNQEIEEKE